MSELLLSLLALLLPLLLLPLLPLLPLLLLLLLLRRRCFFLELFFFFSLFFFFAACFFLLVSRLRLRFLSFFNSLTFLCLRLFLCRRTLLPRRSYLSPSSDDPPRSSRVRFLDTQNTNHVTHHQTQHARLAHTCWRRSAGRGPGGGLEPRQARSERVIAWMHHNELELACAGVSPGRATVASARGCIRSCEVRTRSSHLQHFGNAIGPQRISLLSANRKHLSTCILTTLPSRHRQSFRHELRQLPESTVL